MNEQNEKENLGGQENTSAGSYQTQAGQRQYWSSLDQRRAQGSPPQEPARYGGYNQEPRWNGYQQSGGYRPPQSPHASYQYSANSGWQHQSRHDGRYQWNFEDYDRFDPKRDKGKKRKKSRGVVVFAVSLLCVLSVSLVGLSGYSIYRTLTSGEPAAQSLLPFSEPLPPESSSSQFADSLEPNPEASQMEIAGRPQIGETVPVGGKLTIPQVAKAVSPSVVGVVQFMNTQFFEPAGVGSGIIMSEDGYIITNAHVVRDADALQVVLDNGDPYEATIIGADSRTDLAVIKINATGLPVASFGDSDELEVGETVVAIGNPTGMELAGSVTQGIVSAVNRVVKTTNNSMTYIQTDAAINPGNSGGALVNEYGQVVGINTAKIVQEGYEGIGFAIPISEAKPIIDELLRNGRVTGRVMLGITARAIDEATAHTYNVPMGLQIIEVQNEDLARKGVQARDIITHIDGQPVHTVDDIQNLLKGRKEGDQVTLSIYRQTRVTQHTTFEVVAVLIEDKN